MSVGDIDVKEAFVDHVEKFGRPGGKVALVLKGVLHGLELGSKGVEVGTLFFEPVLQTLDGG